MMRSVYSAFSETGLTTSPLGTLLARCAQTRPEHPLTTNAAIRDRVACLFADARQIQTQAIEQLEDGDIRDAAGKS